MTSRKDFSGKVVLITGSSSGIGEATAIHFCSLGAQGVIITGRDVARLKTVAQKCRDASMSAGAATDVLTVVADVSKDADLKKLIDETIKRFNKLDVLVNNAGVYQVCSIEEGRFMDVYEKIFSVNLRSVLVLTKLAIPHLLASKGAIVNVSSIASTKPTPTNSIYAMSKSSLDMFTQSLAIEFGPQGVRVNAINPAAIRTPIFDKVENSDMDTAKMEELTALSYPLRRIGDPEDCAKAIAYLASEDASFITGVTLLVDGGSQFVQIIVPEKKKL